jgi:hypothetical protein
MNGRTWFARFLIVQNCHHGGNINRKERKVAKKEGYRKEGENE